ncbi:hypothetical protein NDU88_007393 [Pleurodeles waltl]|uniref:Uncharacterized protein n=1 Tax=Pleurodeles waltl TaxID=8319 RepID=A0AAV7SSD4_PLEWA|nr:hypothetical protein NDU88_007393 [Pleurodeles waltl]
MGLSSKPGFPQSKLTSQSLGWALPSSSLLYPGEPWRRLCQGRPWGGSPYPGLCPLAPNARAPGEPLRPRGSAIWWRQQLGWEPLSWAMSSGPPCGKAPGSRSQEASPAWQCSETPSWAPTKPCDGHSLPPACRTLRGPGQRVQQARGGFPCQFWVQGPWLGPHRAQGWVLPSSSLAYPEGPGPGSLPGLVEASPSGSSSGAPAGPQAKALAGPGVGAPILVFVLWPEGRAPGEPLRPHGSAIWWHQQLGSSGCAPCVPTARPDGQAAPHLLMSAHSLPQAQPGLHEVGCVLADGPHRPSVCTRKGVAFFWITRDGVLRTPLRSSGSGTRHRKGLGWPVMGAQVCDHLAALSDGSLLQAWLPTEQTDVPEPGDGTPFLQPAVPWRALAYTVPRVASSAGLGSGAPAGPRAPGQGCGTPQGGNPLPLICWVANSMGQGPAGPGRALLVGKEASGPRVGGQFEPPRSSMPDAQLGLREPRLQSPLQGRVQSPYVKAQCNQMTVL